MKVWNLQDNGNGKCYVKCNPGSERQNHMFSLSCESQPLIIQYAYLDGGNYGLRPRNLKGTHKTENEALRKEAGERNGTQMTWKWEEAIAELEGWWRAGMRRESTKGKGVRKHHGKACFFVS